MLKGFIVPNSKPSICQLIKKEFFKQKIIIKAVANFTKSVEDTLKRTRWYLITPYFHAESIQLILSAN